MTVQCTPLVLPSVYTHRVLVSGRAYYCPSHKELKISEVRERRQPRPKHLFFQGRASVPAVRQPKTLDLYATGSRYCFDADDIVAIRPTQLAPKQARPGSKITQAQRDAQIQKNLAKNKAHRE